MKNKRKPFDLIAQLLGGIAFGSNGIISLVFLLAPFFMNLDTPDYTVLLFSFINAAANIFGLVLTYRNITKYYVQAAILAGLWSLLMFAIPLLLLDSFQLRFVGEMLYSAGIFGIIGAASLFVRSRLIA